MNKVYPSKVSYGMLAFIFLIFYGPMVPNFINLEINVMWMATLSILTLIFAFIVHLFFYTVYTIDDTKLKIKCGFISYKTININEIKEISNTKSLISSPAPSFDRIEIKYKKFDEVIISPKDKFNFANDLLQINPEIHNKITI